MVIKEENIQCLWEFVMWFGCDLDVFGSVVEFSQCVMEWEEEVEVECLFVVENDSDEFIVLFGIG